MPIDPSIISGIRPVEIDSPVNMLAKVLRVQGMQQEAQLGQAKLAEYERGRARQNAMQSLLQSMKPDATDDQRISSLRGGGFFDEADRIEKGIGERRKIDSEAAEREWKVKKDKLTIAGQAFGGVMKNASLENALGTLDYLGQNGILPPELVEQYRGVVQSNPSQIGMLAEQAYRSVLAADKQLDTHQTNNLGSTTQTLGIDPVTGKATVLNTSTNTVSPDARLQADTARRGQDMADARARDQLAQGKTPVGYRQGPDGTLVAIPGGPGDPRNKPPTEFQGKSAAFGARAEQADKILGELQGKYRPAAINSKSAVEDAWLVGGALGAAANKFALTDADQRAEQAQRDFINAVLRQESGAAIGASEFDNARKQYFPQPGDSAAMIQQKAANRKLAIQGLKSNAGHAAFSAPGGASAPQNNGLPSGWTVEVH